MWLFSVRKTGRQTCLRECREGTQRKSTSDGFCWSRNGQAGQVWAGPLTLKCRGSGLPHIPFLVAEEGVRTAGGHTKSGQEAQAGPPKCRHRHLRGTQLAPHSSSSAAAPAPAPEGLPVSCLDWPWSERSPQDFSASRRVPGKRESRISGWYLWKSLSLTSGPCTKE